MTVGTTGESYTGYAPTSGASEYIRFTANGGTDTFTLPWQPGSGAGVEVYVGGVRQFPGSGYRLADNQIIFSSVIPQGKLIDIVGWTYGLVVGNVSAESVGIEQFKTDLVNQLGYQRLFFSIGELKPVLTPAVQIKPGWRVLDDRD